MKHTLLALSLLSVVACSNPTSVEQDRPVLNKWADDRMWAVLEAQEHRDTKALCLMLTDSSATVREAAALALVSVQDSASGPCLVTALKDPVAAVRSKAAAAFGLVADSAGLVLLNAAADAEQDTTTKQLMHEAGFRAELMLRKHDATFLMSYLESDDREIRTRAAQSLARMPKEDLVDATPSVLHAIKVERDPAVCMFLVGALKHCATREGNELLSSLAVSDSLPMIRIAALRSLGAEKPWGQIGDSIFWQALHDADPGVSRTALDVLQKREGLDGARCWKEAQEGAAPHIQFGLYGLALKHGDGTTRQVARGRLRSMGQETLDDYARAEWMSALAQDADSSNEALFRRYYQEPRPPIVRLTALQLLVARIKEQMARSRFASPEVQWALLREELSDVLMQGDPGLIAFACEQLLEADSAALLGESMEHGLMIARRSLHPIRDLETLQLLDQVIAKRDGLPPPEHNAPTFNHPIQRERLLQLKQGQRYRITTTKGEIILATNVNETPGTSLVFDSLVTAGYYNGKSFHRVVPNFVIQGGCPRGDGYGGMPWTLRTEIGSTGFTTGSVGLASAGRDTESCQFFITHVPTPHLDGRYTKFAEVVSGMDVVQRIVVGDRMITVERVE